MRAEILDGACQRVCAETNGSNNQKTQCCDCPSRISHRQKDKFHGRPGDCESPKGKLPQKLAEDLASLNLQISLGAIWSCSTETVNSAGGPHPEHCLDGHWQKLLARNNCVVEKNSSSTSSHTWAASLLVSLFPLLFIIERARFYVPLAALLSIGVF